MRLPLPLRQQNGMKRLSWFRMLCYLPFSVDAFGPSQRSKSTPSSAHLELNNLPPVSPQPGLAFAWNVSPKRPRPGPLTSDEPYSSGMPWPQRNNLGQMESGDLQRQATTDPRQPSSANVFLGILFSVGVVCALASGYDSSSTDSNTLQPLADAATSAAADASQVLDRLEGVADKILDAALPLTASDAVSVTLGEGVAGFMGALLSTSLSTAVRELTRPRRRAPPAIETGTTMKASDRVDRLGGSSGTPRTSSASMDFNDAVASGDYFLTRSAALPLLGATGLPPNIANVVSVIVASVPYELVKLTRRRRKVLQEADRTMQDLLVVQQARENQPFSFLTRPKPVTSVDPESLKPVQNDFKIDYVEVFSDLTKWLEYAVLTENFGGSLAWSGLTTFPYTENFVFGALANLSAQVYADILYAFSGFGGEQKRQEVLSRTFSEWSALYLSSCITGATLFGVYESSQIPAKFLLSALFSGGVEGCVGSNDYDLCVESYLFGNPPPGPTFEAQARAVLTTAASMMSHLGLDSYLFPS